MGKTSLIAVAIIFVAIFGAAAYEDYQSEQTVRQCFKDGGTWNTKPVLAIDHYCERKQAPNKNALEQEG